MYDNNYHTCNNNNNNINLITNMVKLYSTRYHIIHINYGVVIQMIKFNCQNAGFENRTSITKWDVQHTR